MNQKQLYTVKKRNNYFQLYDTFDCPNCKNAFVYSSQKMFDKLNCESCGCNLKSHLESLAVVEDDADTIDRMPG